MVSSDEDIVISGIAGRYPESKDIDEFENNLYNGVDMVTDSTDRWPNEMVGGAIGVGKLKDLDKFDADFFNISKASADGMDTQLRMLLELAYEAIVDAGVDPNSMNGSRTGIFFANFYDQTNGAYANMGIVPPEFQNFVQTLSYKFNWIGPVSVYEAACASSSGALNDAYYSMKLGLCDAAIVVGVNFEFDPYHEFFFCNLNMMSFTGKSKCFDISADGYAQGEACIVAFLQKKSDAKRVYLSFVSIGHNNDGFKEMGITYPSWQVQSKLISETVRKANLDPKDINYIEAHSTGTKVGDPIEMQAICHSFFSGDRTEPLLVGALKSSIGHSEASAGLCAVSKIIMIFKNELIPPNLHLKEINPKIEGILDGRLKPVNETTPFTDDLIVTNSFGFGGSNVTMIVRSSKIKPSIDNNIIVDEIPRLILMCGRNEKTLSDSFKTLLKSPNKITRDCLALINDVSKISPFKTNNGLNGLSYRGFALLESKEPDLSQIKGFNVKEVKENGREVWFIMSGLGAQYAAMAKDMIKIDSFRKSIETVCEITKKYAFDLMDFLMNDKIDMSKAGPEITMSCTTAIQIALVDLLEELGIQPDGYIGHSNGELICAYVDKCLTKEQIIDILFLRTKSLDGIETNSAMAAIAMGAEQLKPMLPEGVYICCDNTEDSVTIGGEKTIITELVSNLKAKDVMCAIVNAGGYAFHCPLVSDCEKSFRQYLKNIVPRDWNMSSKWMSTVCSDRVINSDYFADNFLYLVKFRSALKRIPKNAILIEVSPRDIFQSIITESLGSQITYIPLMRRNQNNVNFFLTSIGKLYTLGLNPNIERLYPSVQYPVSTETRFLSPLVKWDHSVSHVVHKYPEFYNYHQKDVSKVKVNVKEEPSDRFILDHRIDGKCLFPATGYLNLVWKKLAQHYKKEQNHLAVEFKDVNIHRATIISNQAETTFEVALDHHSGKFVVMEGGSQVATGTILILNSGRDLQFQYILSEDNSISDAITMNSKDIYKEFRLRGYDYGHHFQCIEQSYCDQQRVVADVQWRDNWVPFMDNMLQVSLLGLGSRGLFLPVRISLMRVDPQVVLYEVSNNNLMRSVYDPNLKIAVAKGFELMNCKMSLAPRSITKKPFLGYQNFVPYVINNFRYDNQNDLLEYKGICDRLAQEVSRKWTDLKLANDNLINDLRNSLNVIKSELKMSLFDLLLDIYQRGYKDIDSEKLFLLGEDAMIGAHNEEAFIETLLSIVYDNQMSSEVKVVEINESKTLLNSQIYSTFEVEKSVDYALLHSTPEQLSDEVRDDIEVTKWDTTQTTLPNYLKNSDLIVYKHLSTALQTNSTQNPDLKQTLNTISDALKPKGFLLIIFRTEHTFAEQTVASLLGLSGHGLSVDQVIQEADKLNFVLIANYCDAFSVNALLFRKNANEVPVDRQVFLELSDSFDWIDRIRTDLQEIDSKPDGINLWLVSKKDPTNGILGFYNCLKREMNANRVRLLMNISKESDEKTINEKQMREIIRKDLKINVINGNNIGFYKIFKMKPMAQPILSEHSYLNITTKGDLSSFKWFECQHKYWPHGRKTNEALCRVYYSSLNFKDVMLATGRLPADALSPEVALQDCILGIEFSGRDENGNRVMGMTPAKALATTCVVEGTEFLWPIPNHWSMEEAATIPCVYATAYYGLIIRGKLKRGEKVLIHSGSGGVGQAAINVCLDMGCQLFVSVGSMEKRQFLKKIFPKLKDHNFCSSRDLTFKTHILQQTNGLGVDVVLNSLSDDKLKASLECLANNGRFLEIGKYDMSVDTKLELAALVRNKNFHGVHLDALCDWGKNSSIKATKDTKLIYQLIKEGIEKGVVKPLKRTVFPFDRSEDAFRFMASGKHVGKVLIKIRDEELVEASALSSVRIPSIPRTVFHPNKSYIITGGLGGMGLEVIEWMVERGAKKFVITSRSGPKEPYQHKKLRNFLNSGVDIVISNEDLSSINGTEKLIRSGEQLSPIGGIFHLQMILMDALFDNQTKETFQKVCATKSESFKNLDQLSRKLCPHLDYFVGFSSIVSSFGNVGQTNYGYSNSVIDRVCELRKVDGFPALAIQWGVIGDVGVVADTMSSSEEFSVLFSVPQRIPSCLQALDRFLQSEHTICTSFVKTQMKLELKSSNQIDLMQRISQILGVGDLNKIDPNTKLVKLGMDSLMIVEVKQVIEQNSDEVFSNQQIRELTLDSIKNMSPVRRETKLKSNSSDRIDLIQRISHILGVGDLNKMDPNTKLTKLGIDSLMIVELKQVIEQNSDRVFSNQQIRELTLDMIKNMSSVKKEVRKKSKSSNSIDLMQRISHILGVGDLSKMDLNTKLVKLGVDSLMIVELKQVIEQNSDRIFSNQQIRELTLDMIKKMSSKN